MCKYSEASTQQPTVTMCNCQHPVQHTTQAVPAQYIAVNTAEASDLWEYIARLTQPSVSH